MKKSLSDSACSLGTHPHWSVVTVVPALQHQNGGGWGSFVSPPLKRWSRTCGRTLDTLIIKVKGEVLIKASLMAFPKGGTVKPGNAARLRHCLQHRHTWQQCMLASTTVHLWSENFWGTVCMSACLSLELLRMHLPRMQNISTCDSSYLSCQRAGVLSFHSHLLKPLSSKTVGMFLATNFPVD